VKNLLNLISPKKMRGKEMVIKKFTPYNKRIKSKTTCLKISPRREIPTEPLFKS